MVFKFNLESNKKLDELQEEMYNFNKNYFYMNDNDSCFWSIKYISQDENGNSYCDNCDNWSMNEDGVKEVVLNCEWILNNIKQFVEEYEEIVIYASVINENGSDDIELFTLWNKLEDDEEENYKN